MELLFPCNNIYTIGLETPNRASSKNQAIAEEWNESSFPKRKMILNVLGGAQF
ncbi:hypothetical protein SLEP1_g181 [Rubroshorea leprosula]|uniref:Uncharacterized protein n=1 Tax=Rubroshorea leprosula TaxID=152421 RepID=A0AAV5HIG0_9ROSI|nr:hypothetical protein SLEP1_g181 [Rubroshorea leprosula]